MDKVLIYANGNREIATGHLMRCLVIARALVREGAEVLFAVSDEDSAELLSKLSYAGRPGDHEAGTGCGKGGSYVSGSEPIPLSGAKDPDYDRVFLTGGDYRDPMGEIPAIARTARERGCGTLLFDSYYIKETFFENMRAALGGEAKIAYIDDLSAMDYRAGAPDIVINYDLLPDTSIYEAVPVRCLGGAYSPLREQFDNAEYEVRTECRDILVSTGGSDGDGFAYELLSAFTRDERFKDCRFHVPAGAAFTDECIKRIMTLPGAYMTDEGVGVSPLIPRGRAPDDRHAVYVRSHIPGGRVQDDRHATADGNGCDHNEDMTVRVLRNVGSMAALMSGCDLAVAAAGTTLYELASIGVPAVSFALADNQVPNAEQFEQAAGIPYAGMVPGREDAAKIPYAGAVQGREDAAKMPQAVMAKGREDAARRILGRTYEIMHDADMRKRLSLAMRGAVPAGGAARIAKALTGIRR